MVLVATLVCVKDSIISSAIDGQSDCKIKPIALHKLRTH